MYKLKRVFIFKKMFNIPIFRSEREKTKKNKKKTNNNKKETQTNKREKEK